MSTFLFQINFGPSLSVFKVIDDGGLGLIEATPSGTTGY